MANIPKIGTWNRFREKSGWSGGLIDWVEDGVANVSVVFSWQLQQAYQRAIWYRTQGYPVKIGGPAAILHPELYDEIAELGGSVDAPSRHNPKATFTTRGCIRRCKFCAVHRIEPKYLELRDWPIRPVICDNNFLACSKKHFDSVIDKLKLLKEVDFNQGLDARLMTEYHVSRLAELDMKCVRIAWDHSKTEPSFRKAWSLLMDAEFKPGMVRVYVLIGYKDTPEDALYRLETVKQLGGLTNPMRFQPLDVAKKNNYVAPGWTNDQLVRYMRYWSNLRITSPIPFSEFANKGEYRSPIADNGQLPLEEYERPLSPISSGS